MATIATAQAGNWSAGTTWSGGVAPTTGDDASLGHSVIVNGNFTCDKVVSTYNGAVLTISEDCSLTGLITAPGGGSNWTLTMEAGATFSYNVAADIDLKSLRTINATGTALKWCTLANVHASGSLSWTLNSGSALGLVYTDWLNCKNLTANVNRLDHVNIEGVANGVVNIFYDLLYAPLMSNINISNFSGTGTGLNFGTLSPIGSMPLWSNIVLGTDRSGNAQANAKDFAFSYDGAIHCENLIWSAATPVTITRTNVRIAIDNLGFANCNGTVTGTRGVWYTETDDCTIQRSTTNPYTAETYCALVTPKSTCAAPGAGGAVAADIDLWVPIVTGDAVSVTTHARRNGLSADCGDLIVDPEGTWFTATTTATALTDNATYYEVTATPAGTAAGTAEKGSLHIVLRCKEYAVGETMQWGGVEITVGDKTYTVSHQQGQMGMPIPDEPEAAATGGAQLGAFENGAWR